MRALSVDQAQAGFEQVIDAVGLGHERVTIEREHGGGVVLMSLSDYNSMVETAYLLGTAANATRLQMSIAQHKASRQRPE